MRNKSPVSGRGQVVPGDGGIYYDVKFEAMVIRLALQEVIEGLVVETTSFWGFCQSGPIDAMLHVSPDLDEYINYDREECPAYLPGVKTVHWGRRCGAGPGSNPLPQRERAT